MLRCSFCRKSEDQVAKLISSSGWARRSYICDECVETCNSILRDGSSAPRPRPTSGLRRMLERVFPGHPRSGLEYSVLRELATSVARLR